MKDVTVSDRARLTGLVLACRLRGLARAARRPIRALITRPIRSPVRLTIAPQDIRTADPTVATDIYSCYFVFDGKAVNTRGLSPFDVVAPSEAWAATLAGFGWLRHLRAAETALARVNARALVDDWITGLGRSSARPDWRPDVVARRLVSWLSQSPLILDGADKLFYRRFMRSLARQSDALLVAVDRSLEGTTRLVALVALSEVALCADGLSRLQRLSSRLLADEIGRQVLADGGHISRDPGLLIELLLDFLPLRQAYAARGVTPPLPLLNAIDRMMPMVRTFRHGDGSLALFNGMGVTRPDTIATVLAYDDARGTALQNASSSGYQRVQAGAAMLIVDAGGPPPAVFAQAAHAGTLAFEFSVGPQRIVVNCGAAAASQPAARDASRATAAHSTLVLADRSSSRFAPNGWLGSAIYAGPCLVTSERIEGPDGIMLDLSHDGYVRRFGYRHERQLWLAADGGRLGGEDRLVAAPKATKPETSLPFAIRFHLHPSVRTATAQRGTAILIAVPDGQRWSFEAGGLPVTIEDSIFFAHAEGPRRTDQLVVRGQVPDARSVSWSFTRNADSAGQV